MSKKTSFTKEEYNSIVSLVKQLEDEVDSSKKKNIRQKLRNIGLYWSEVANGIDYTVSNLIGLFENGTLKILNDDKEYNVETSILPKNENSSLINNVGSNNRREASDEYYVIGLCDKILGMKAEHQYKFDFLKGDTGIKLPVDAYYPKLNMVVEYYESQHTESTPFFDSKKTASGVSRGDQRRMYDQRRSEVLPKHGIKLVVISYTDFGSSKKLVRNYERDLKIVENILMSAGISV